MNAAVGAASRLPMFGVSESLSKTSYFLSSKHFVYRCRAMNAEGSSSKVCVIIINSAYKKHTFLEKEAFECNQDQM